MITYNGERIVDAAFAEQVYEAVARIPRGKVATYGQIAAQVGDTLAGREVGHCKRQSYLSLIHISEPTRP